MDIELEPYVHNVIAEAGGSDDFPSAIDVSQWPSNLGSEYERGYPSGVAAGNDAFTTV